MPKEEFTRRFNDFAAGRWLELLASAQPLRPRETSGTRTMDDEARAELVEAKVMIGELSAGRQVLESAGLAPGTQATF